MQFTFGLLSMQSELKFAQKENGNPPGGIMQLAGQREQRKMQGS